MRKLIALMSLCVLLCAVVSASAQSATAIADMSEAEFIEAMQAKRMALIREMTKRTGKALEITRENAVIGKQYETAILRHGAANHTAEIKDHKYHKENVEEALKWLTVCAEKGSTLAQNDLGYMYRYGKLVPKDYKLALKWLKRASESGYPESQYALGTMYEDGKGVKINHTEAYTLFTLAAEQGYMAQQRLGELYESGSGVKKDLVQAYMWYALSCSKEDMKKVERRLSPQQLLEARSLAINWKPTYRPIRVFDE